MSNFNLCIIKPNKSAFSETFIAEHINRLNGNKKVLYGGSFPVYDDKENFLISSKIGLVSYLFQKRILRKKDIKIRTNALVEYFKKQRIDVVFAEYGTTGAMVTQACKMAHIPLIIHYHGADAYHKRTLEQYSDYYKVSFDYSCGIIAVSLDMVEKLIQLGASRNKITFISCGVDIQKFPLIPITPHNNFITVGRFVEKKSPFSVIRAFKLLVDKLPNCKLWMVGNGPLYNKTLELIKELGLEHNITLTGVISQDEIKLLFKNSKCYVQHSVTADDGDKEGTPVAILEASASGLPVVSTKHGGINEAVIDGISGYLVDEYDIPAMAAKMLKIASSTSEELEIMGKAGRNHIYVNYNVDKQMQRLNDIILQAM